MKSHVKVAVIGGGVVGCSVLYHLTKRGEKDVVLIERDELTSGSSWHAAGSFHTLNGDPNVAQLQEYTIGLYQEIEEISGQSCGLHLPGGLMLASSPERMEWLKTAHAQSRHRGIETELISIEEAFKLFPLMDTSKFLGALWNPLEGHLDPSGTTHAYAKAAKVAGAEIYLRNRVTDLQPRSDGGWNVITEQGTIIAENVVNAGGLWGREVGRMVGIELPVLAMAHQYLITEEIPEVVAHDREIVHVIDFEGEIYMRQEANGMLMGTYEKNGTPWSEVETPWDFGMELLPPDLDRIADNLERGFERYPPFQRAGIKNIINGPFTFAPDGNPLVGPVRGLPNYWVAVGVMAGFSQGGGVGSALANWIVDGDPGMDIWAMDVARYGDFATPEYTNAKVRENYGRRFSLTFPNEELPAARPMDTTPVYEHFKAKHAVFGASFGLEYPLWFAPSADLAHETPTFRRSEAFEHVARECHGVRASVGLSETSAFAIYEVSGAGAEDYLSRLMANRLPRQGKLILTPMLNDKGTLCGDFTITRLADDRFQIFGSGIAEEFHLRWFADHLPKSGVTVKSLRPEIVGLSIAGPQSRDLMAKLTDVDLSSDAFGFLSFGQMEIAGLPAQVGRISFTGELGYEIWMKREHQLQIYQAIVAAGEDHSLIHFGGRALDSLRLEKSFGSFTRDYTSDYTPLESGLTPFVDFDKPDFIGRDAVLREREQGPQRKLATFIVEGEDGADSADPVASEPIYLNGSSIGLVTSGGFGHVSGHSIALGYIPAEAYAQDNDFTIDILGQRRVARLTMSPLIDPQGKRMRQ